MSTAKRDADAPRATGALDTQPDQAATDHTPPSDTPDRSRPARPPLASTTVGGAYPLRPDCLGMRMRLQDGSTVVMPFGRLKTNP